MLLIDFTNPYTILTATVLFLLVLFLAKETKKGMIPAIMLGVFLVIIIGHSVELSLLKENIAEMQSVIGRCIAVDFVFILLSFFSYLWIDDIEAKAKKKKSIDNSLNWFWSKV